MASGPSIVVWTEHAFDKAQREGWVPTDVEVALLEQHARRRVNAGDADWILEVGVSSWRTTGLLLGTAYARIVTVWRRAR
ncbi:MAG: hypothetical protein M3482_02325 [Actinomycetota bacterium]|nr:hypothetical protein [Actinomycetota bacterium]